MEQNQSEAAWLLRLMQGSRAILEIGSRRGGFLRKMARYCRPESTICSIDLGRDIEGYISESYGHHLEQTIEKIRKDGHKAECLIADSTTPEAIAWAKQRAPFDFIFIDGDHSYEGVKSDWDNYGWMGSIIGFHDILNPRLGVGKLWNEISHSHNSILICAESSQMGIGVIYKTSPQYVHDDG